jgi:hypothetical protein
MHSHMEVSGQLDASAVLFARRSLLFPLDRRLGGPQSRFGCGDEKNIPVRNGNRTPVVQSIAQPLF